MELWSCFCFDAIYASRDPQASILRKQTYLARDLKDPSASLTGWDPTRPHTMAERYVGCTSERVSIRRRGSRKINKLQSEAFTGMAAGP